MLKLRVLTALVLIPLVIWGVIALPEPLFAAVLALVLALGAWEWARLAGIHNVWMRLLYVIAVALVMALTGYAISASEWVLPVVLAGVVLWWLLAARWVASYPRVPAGWSVGIWARAMIGVVVLVAPWAALVALHDGPSHGPYYVLFLLLLIWVADTGAYFAGRRWGVTKLAPRVSPGKTWEGVWGAMTGSLLVAVAGGLLFGLPARSLLLFVLLCVLTVAFSILGDLMESLFKREAGMKDSSHMLPGHGGMLDRIDSLTAAAPVFVLGLLIMGAPA